MADLKYPFPEIPAAGEISEVADGVFWIRMPLPFGLDHINLWLLADDDGWTIVDTGIKAVEVQQIWESLIAGPMGGRPVKRLICTHHHPDHFGLAGWLCARLDTTLWMSRTEYFYGLEMMLDLPKIQPPEVMSYYIRAGLDPEGLKKMETANYDWLQEVIVRPPLSHRRLSDADELIIGGRLWRVVMGQGHSPEHACLLNEELGVLISGDQVLPRISSNVSVMPLEPFANPLREWIDSLWALKSLHENLLVLPAHNEPFYGLHARLDELIQMHQSRLDTIEILCETPLTAVEILPHIFRRKLEDFNYNLALGECLSHLHYLVEEGSLVAREDELGVCRFSRI